MRCKQISYQLSLQQLNMKVNHSLFQGFGVARWHLAHQMLGGFNGQGMKAAKARLKTRTPIEGQLLGVNIGANKITQDKPSDY